MTEEFKKWIRQNMHSNPEDQITSAEFTTYFWLSKFKQLVEERAKLYADGPNHCPSQLDYGTAMVQLFKEFGLE